MKDNIDTCPNCGGQLYADFINVGPGAKRVTPYTCIECPWNEIDHGWKDFTIDKQTPDSPDHARSN